MKKARIMLSALGVLVVVGSALAFKANEAYSGTLRCGTGTIATTTDVLPATNCPTGSLRFAADEAGTTIRFCTNTNAPATARCYATATLMQLP